MLAPGAGLISGIVRDASGNQIVGAHVSLLGTDQAMVTDALGSFQFLNLAHGKFTLRVDAEGFKSAEAAVGVRTASVTQTRVTLVPLPADEPVVAQPQTTAALAVAPEWAIASFVAACVGMLLLGWWLRGQPRRRLRRAEADLKAGRLEKAEARVRRVLRRSSDATAWFVLGAVLIKRTHYHKAVRELEAAAAAYDPGMAGLAFLIALAHNRLGQKEQARRWLPLVARDLGYWNALNDDPESALTMPVRRAVVTQVDPAYG